MFLPRPYQAECVDRVFAEFDGGARSTLVVKATGLGKTVVVGHATKRWRAGGNHRKVLVLAHREELIFQAKDKIEAIASEPVEIEMGDFKASHRSLLDESPVGVFAASVQSLYRWGRLQKFRPDGEWLVIIDEAHHATPTNRTYSNIVEHFQKNAACKLLGVTATPDRSDEIALGQIFETVAYDMGIVDGIEGGWLVPIRQQIVFVEDLDISKVHTTQGDLNAAELEEIISEEKMLHRIVSPTLQIAQGRPTLVFAPGVESAHKLADVFNRHAEKPEGNPYMRAVAIDGKTDSDERRHQLKRFRRGEFGVLCGCQVFTEGFDEPSIQVVAMAASTKSRSRYSQQVGRGTRPCGANIDAPGLDDAGRRAAIAASGKPHLTVIDFVGNAGRHKLIHAADILGGKYSDEIIERAKDRAKAKGKDGIDSDTLLELEAARQEAEESRRAARKQVIAEAIFRVREIDPFDVLDVSAGREPGYLKGKPASEKQLNWLKRHGVRPERGLSLHKAKALIDKIVERQAQGLCNPKQAAVITAHGYDAAGVTVERAAELIREINQNMRLAKA